MTLITKITWMPRISICKFQSFYYDGGKLFVDKKRLENRKFVHLASTYFRLLGRIKDSVFLLNETITYIVIEWKMKKLNSFNLEEVSTMEYTGIMANMLMSIGKCGICSMWTTPRVWMCSKWKTGLWTWHRLGTVLTGELLIFSPYLHL